MKSLIMKDRKNSLCPEVWVWLLTIAFWGFLLFYKACPDHGGMGGRFMAFSGYHD
jgi:hypothetical protein